MFLAPQIICFLHLRGVFSINREGTGTKSKEQVAKSKGKKSFILTLLFAI